MKYFLLLFFTISVFYAQAQSLPIVIEAESGMLGSDFEVINENEITFVRPKTDLLNGSFPGDSTKTITFNIVFPEAGDYYLYVKLRVGEANYNDDSFYLAKSFDGASANNADHWHIANGLVPVGHNANNEVVTGAGNVGNMTWKWINISAFINNENPLVYSVGDETKPHSFTIGAREDGLDIDKIAFGKTLLNFTVSNLENIEAGSEDTPDENGFPSTAYTQVKTFINPIMPGDHPDMTLFKDGDNFYACGSNFHFVPYLPILHSTDLVHWEEICRVIPASWNGIVSDAPQAGTWAGVITYFYNSYWIYFSNTAGGGQYFCKADNPAGPWSTPVKVKTTATTGAIGYDNSIFVDDDGTPYMLIKPGQVVNRIQEVGTDGHLIGNALNLDWVNQDKKYSWAEGPVMCKHEGWYYYFVAGNVYGGQYVLRSRELTDNPESWEEMGNFFENTTDPKSTFRSPNHIAQPFELNDGTWWTISHSYESLGSDDWNGQGRQGMLHQIYWDSNGKPTGKAVTSTPQLKPNLPKSGIPWKTPRSDSFENEEIELSWHFMNRKAAKQYSLDDKTGWLTLLPGSGKTHILHKEARHHYALVTQLDFDAQTNKHEAGIYLTNGNESVTAELFSGFDNGKIIGFRFGNTLHITENEIGNNLWLKVERYGHLLSAFYSSNGISWIQVGKGINVSALDKGQENYNWWVGTSNGLYAAGAKAAFNCYAFKDGFSVLPIVGYNNYFGLETKGTGTNKAMYNSSDKGGWAMLAGVDLGSGLRVPEKIQVEAASNSGGQIEVWIDDLENQGTLIATIDITDTGGESTWQHFEAPIGEISGQHDIFIRWKGPANAFLLKSIQFIVAQDYTNATKNASLSKAIKVYPNPFEHGITVETINTNSTYQIYTLSGQMVETGTIGSSPQIIGTSLAQGLYLLKNGSEIIKINKIK